MGYRYPKSLEAIEFLPGIRVGIVLEGNLIIIGTLVAEIDGRHHHEEVPPLHVNVDEDPEFLLIQLTTAFTLTVGAVTLTFPIGTIVAVNLEEILLIGPA